MWVIVKKSGTQKGGNKTNIKTNLTKETQIENKRFLL
jgi:hypothetical protein